MDSTGKSNRSPRDAEFLQLLGKHELQLAACIHAVVPSWHDAEDIFQETKIRLWDQFDKFQSGTDFVAWGCTIARLLAKAHFKQTQRRPCLLSDDLMDSVLLHLGQDPEAASHRMEALRLCMNKLGREGRDLLHRRYFQKQSVQTIATEVHRTLAGTYAAISRLRQTLMLCVHDRLRQEDSV